MSELLTTKKQLQTFQKILGQSAFIVTRKDRATPLIITKCAHIVKIILEAFPSLSKNLKLSKKMFSVLFDSNIPLVFDLYNLKFETLILNEFYILRGLTLKSSKDIENMLKYIKNRNQVKKV
jgi:hypothetical protein